MDSFLFFALQCFYLLVPGLFANAAPVIFRKVDFLNYPVDFGRKFRGKPLFGSHKTYRGFFFGILMAILFVWLQRLLFLRYDSFRSVSLIDYSAQNFVLLGFLIGFGVLFGDLVKSFVKRRVNIKPGKSWFPWDQLDCLIGGLLFISTVYILPWQVIVFLFVAVPVLHVLINLAGYYLGLKKNKL
jgi:CDP-2,3-bis-(O-geranylgeranyl)-sn-glycerol synthase